MLCINGVSNFFKNWVKKQNVSFFVEILRGIGLDNIRLSPITPTNRVNNLETGLFENRQKVSVVLKVNVERIWRPFYNSTIHKAVKPAAGTLSRDRSHSRLMGRFRNKTRQSRARSFVNHAKYNWETRSVLLCKWYYEYKYVFFYLRMEYWCQNIMKLQIIVDVQEIGRLDFTSSRFHFWQCSKTIWFFA